MAIEPRLSRWDVEKGSLGNSPRGGSLTRARALGWSLGLAFWFAGLLPVGAASAAPPGGRADSRLQSQTAAIAGEVARLRSLSLIRPVPVRTLSRASFEKMLRGKVDEELPPSKAHGLELALEAIGWIEPPFSIREALVGLVSSQAAALYDPESDVYLFIEGVADSQVVDMISSHELVHALTDQHFDLDAHLMRPAREGKLSEDEIQAFRFVVEGDATYVMMKRALATVFASLLAMTGDPSGGGSSAPDEAKLDLAIRSSLGALVSMPYSAQIETMMSGGAGLGKEMSGAIAALDSMPVVLVRPLLGAYLRGALLVADVRARGGWAAVDSLYRNPPTSTEQVLHLEKLYPERDVPRRPTLPPLKPGERLSFEDTMGELYVRTLFEANGMADEADGLAAGWDGDRIAVAESDKSWSAVWVTLWDDQEEALAFEGGLRRLFEKRPNSSAIANAEDAWEVRGRPTLIGRIDDRVVIAQADKIEKARDLLASALQ